VIHLRGMVGRQADEEAEANGIRNQLAIAASDRFGPEDRLVGVARDRPPVVGADEPVHVRGRDQVADAGQVARDAIAPQAAGIDKLVDLMAVVSSIL
jgi:hypothetical protein